ncbi:MAG: DUF4349 domain-containing protein [Treponema sp.]|nr:DUF4349 domain-containing protein [Treponema sp.]
MKKLATILTMLAVVLIIGCDAHKIGSRQSVYDMSYDDGMAYNGKAFSTANISFAERDMSDLYAQEEISEAFPVNDSSSESAIINENERKLIKRANFRIRVESLETSDSSITNMMNKYDGYAALTEFEENSRYYSLRIPANRYETFLSELEGLGRLIRRSENIEDVTVRYYDLESRLESKKELLKTFQSYLGRARTMEEILAVETHIADLQRDIDFTGTQLRDLTNRIDYATIDLYLQGPVTQTIYKNDTFGERMKRLFSGFGNFLASTAVFILGFIIYGLPIIGILILLIWLLFGRVGLMKRLWRLIMAKKQ